MMTVTDLHTLDRYNYNTHKLFCSFTSRWYVAAANNAIQDRLLTAHSYLQLNNSPR
jgi:hypothetical protein